MEIIAGLFTKPSKEIQVVFTPTSPGAKMSEYDLQDLLAKLGNNARVVNRKHNPDGTLTLTIKLTKPSVAGKVFGKLGRIVLDTAVFVLVQKATFHSVNKAASSIRHIAQMYKGL